MAIAGGAVLTLSVVLAGNAPMAVVQPSCCASRKRKFHPAPPDDTCNAFIARGVPINHPPRDGCMAFICTPDGISIELRQAGGVAASRTLARIPNTDSW